MHIPCAIFLKIKSDQIVKKRMQCRCASHHIFLRPKKTPVGIPTGVSGNLRTGWQQPSGNESLSYKFNLSWLSLKSFLAGSCMAPQSVSWLEMVLAFTCALRSATPQQCTLLFGNRREIFLNIVEYITQSINSFSFKKRRWILFSRCSIYFLKW